MHRCATVLVLASAIAIAPRAFAQTTGERAATAQALFDEAMRLMKANQDAAACPKLEESVRLDPAMAAQFRLAECYEKVGKIASAWATFVAVADAASATQRSDRETLARQRAEALAPRVPRLSITVPPSIAAVAGLAVQRDGSAVGAPQWGVAVPLDPGEHVVTATAPGKKTWEAKVTLAASPVVVTIGPLQDAPGDIAPAPPSQSPPSRRSAIPAIILGSVAAAGVGTGVALFVVHTSQRSDAEKTSAQIEAAHGTCVPGAAAFSSQCTALAKKASNADAFGNASTVAFAAAGGAAAAAAISLLWPTSKSSPTSARAIQITPAFGERCGGLSATGSF